ncbi:MAG: tyrosine protein phosphatase [Xanthobacteraceae bacterium]|nr:tyrosine protein phosphatase [Xanthobacteraceae bacterium]QYK45586.1 MAG: tyrosine protein phosphatase [Xanthobacteraceae bacterium]HMN51867.1 protein-tyrosine phosphatase family protein [Xanthobacteraceae bacterium]
MIHVCSLSRLHNVVDDTGAEHVVTLIRDTSRVTRPRSIREENHLILSIDDIEDELEGMIAPAETHVAELLTFVERWERRKPMVVHCFAGISRSTAAAFITACAIQPEKNEAEIARAIRSASITAQPNPRIVGFGDKLLGRGGRMVEAVRAIGKGDFGSGWIEEAEPFVIKI